MATYECDSGYLMVESTNRMCQINGSWSGSEPSCVDKFSQSSGEESLNLEKRERVKEGERERKREKERERKRERSGELGCSACK